jgi:enoyl-CoA hydratase
MSASSLSADSPTNDFKLMRGKHAWRLRLISADGMNRLTRAKVMALRSAIEKLAETDETLPLIILCEKNFSAGADLNEIRQLSGADAFEFARGGQALMNAVAHYPVMTIAAIEGHCMGGGLDLAWACRRRVAAPGAVFGHRGAALGLMTGWGGTQRLPRLVGKARALEILMTADKVSANRALELGLVDSVVADPVAEVERYAERFICGLADANFRPSHPDGAFAELDRSHNQ